MLKPYNELTEAQKSLVYVMYSDRETVQHYLYNFDGERYVGRQFIPTHGVIVAGPVEASKPAEEAKPKPRRSRNK